MSQRESGLEIDKKSIAIFLNVQFVLRRHCCMCISGMHAGIYVHSSKCVYRRKNIFEKERE